MPSHRYGLRSVTRARENQHRKPVTIKIVGRHSPEQIRQTVAEDLEKKQRSRRHKKVTLRVKKQSQPRELAPPQPAPAPWRRPDFIIVFKGARNLWSLQDRISGRCIWHAERDQDRSVAFAYHGNHLVGLEDTTTGKLLYIDGRYIQAHSLTSDDVITYDQVHILIEKPQDVDTLPVVNIKIEED
ncbi:hypothetical protein JX266_004281 [Neoarthrinium moseri]|nr:hypothetical protein JX266_004281 [Neoarthrinium moseri]